MTERFTLKDPLARTKNTKVIQGYIDDHGCYICDSHRKSSDGRYYQIKRDKKMMMLHRYVFETYCSDIPLGLIIMHKCDNNLCINPTHLELGTHIRNMEDMVQRGRSSKGSKCGTSKLNEVSAMEIRLSKLSIKELMNIYKVSQRTIYSIKSGEVWQ
jgi:hypothetical protein